MASSTTLNHYTETTNAYTGVTGQPKPCTKLCQESYKDARSRDPFFLVVPPLLRLLKRSLTDSTNKAFAYDIATIIQSLNDLTTLK